MFEQKLAAARNITEHVVIGMHIILPGWMKELMKLEESILDFILNNTLHILNSSPFDYTFEKGCGKSSIDSTLYSSALLSMCSNWRTDDYELKLHSDHLPITFNIKADWAPSAITRQKIETWNLRNNQWELFRQILHRNLEEWKKSLPEYLPDDAELLDLAFELWTKCVVEAGKRSIGMKTVWKGNKPWRSDLLHRKRKQVHKLKRELRRYRTQYD